MIKVVAINGSPRMNKGNAAMILTPFIQGMTDAGAEVTLFYASQLKIKPCSCSGMFCWYEKPGECCIKDDMQMLYPVMREAEILILATPVYIPLPSAMQKVVNRLCPLIEPFLEMRNGRTRARFHKNVNIKKIALVSTGGWWEKGNFETVLHIAKELALNSSVDFVGGVLRPHAFLMKKKGKLTEDGEAIVKLVKKAGYNLIKKGKMQRKTLDDISRPLISEKELRDRYNRAL